jgi:hypothetical protein
MKAIYTVITGGVTFWLLDVVIHLIDPHFSGASVLALTALLPAITIWAFLRLDAAGRRTVRGWPRAYLMLLGIWMLGPGFMMTSATVGGAGFRTWNAHSDWAMLINPGVTFIMATYDGALGALMLITLILPLMSLVKVLRRSKVRVGEGAP